MKVWTLAVACTLAACVGAPSNGNGGRSGSPVDVEGPGGGTDSADTGSGTDTGGGIDTGGNDTGTWDTGRTDTGDTGETIPTDEFADLGSIVGEGVVEGDTTGLADDYVGDCGGNGYGDALYLWQAPRAGVWTFDLSGSSFDTAMAVFDVDSGTELACDDDSGDSATSLLSVELARNAQVTIAVDGYGGEGYFVLSIREG